MPDWKRYVREHLPPLGVSGARSEEIVEELAQQLEGACQEALSRGASEAEALAHAEGQFPDWAAVARDINLAERPAATAVAERLPGVVDLSGTRRPGVWRDFAQDLRYSVRALGKTPGFTAMVVLTLALGIGANATIFSVVNAVLLRPLPYPEAQRLVVVAETFPAKGWERFSIAPANFLDWRAQNRSFEHLAATVGAAMSYSGKDSTEQLTALRVSEGYFEALGVAPELGQTFHEGDFQPGRNYSVVLGHTTWQRLYGGDRNVLGRSITLNRQSHVIRGVMPPMGESNVALWVPLVFPEQWRQARGGHFLGALARLKEGVSLEQARSEMTTIASRLAQQYPDSNAGWGASVTPLHEAIAGNVRRPLLVLLGAVGFVLLIACANVANMLLMRRASRGRELAVRAALGAGRWRLVRQLLTESVLLGLGGGALGLAIAYWGARTVPAVNPGLIPRAQLIEVDGTVLAFTFAAALVTSLLFGAAPALAATRTVLYGSLKSSGRGGGLTPRHQRARKALVVAEVALALMLLVGAGLLLHSFARLTTAEPGFRTDHTLLFTITLPAKSYPKAEDQAAFFDEALARVRGLPGVESAAMTSMVPLSGADTLFSFYFEGQAVPPESQQPSAVYYLVSPGYFETLRVALVSGRFFTERDSATAPHVCIISERIAREFFPGRSALGQRMHIGRNDSMAREVVGVVRGTKHYALGDPELFQVYEPYDQFPGDFESMRFAARTRGEPLAVAPAARGAIRSLDAQLPVARVQAYDELLGRVTALPKFHTLLLTLFAGLGVALAAVGLYGVLAFSVAQRTQEMGVRMALGARPGDVLRLVLREGMLLAAAGVALGIACALPLSKVLEKFLFAVRPRDAATFAGVPLVLLAVALAACYLPARRATRVDPVVALRDE